MSSLFIKTASENPVLWTGMKGAPAESRKKVNQMLKQVQHDMTVRFCSFLEWWIVGGKNRKGGGDPSTRIPVT